MTQDKDEIKDVVPIKTNTKLEKTLQNITPDAWIAADLKTKGMSLHRIEEHFCGTYTLQEISYMIKTVTAANQALAIQNPDMLRQLLVDEIDKVKQQMYGEEGFLDEKRAAIVLKAIDQQAKLLGVNKPEEVKVDVTHTIKTANETLADKLDNFRKAYGKKEVIDVTPVEEEE